MPEDEVDEDTLGEFLSDFKKRKSKTIHQIKTSSKETRKRY